MADCKIGYSGPASVLEEQGMAGGGEIQTTFDADYLEMAFQTASIVENKNAVLGGAQYTGEVAAKQTGASDDDEEDDESSQTTQAPTRSGQTSAAKPTGATTTDTNLGDIVSTSTQEGFAAQMTAAPFLGAAAAMFMAGVAAL